jgi:hypothetical protein
MPWVDWLLSALPDLLPVAPPPLREGS